MSNTILGGRCLVASIFLFILRITAYGQDAPTSAEMKSLNSSFIVIGQVISDSTLVDIGVDSAGGAPKIYSLRSEFDGKVYKVESLNILKGPSEGGRLFEILSTARGDSIVEPFALFRSKRYLLFLDSSRVDTSFLCEHHLQGRLLYSPFGGSRGVIDLETAEGVEELSQELAYLNLPEIRIDRVPLTNWLDSLVQRIERGLAMGQLRDRTFADTLEAALQSARMDLTRDDSVACARQVHRTENMVEGAFSTFDRIRVISKDFYSLLASDLTYLESRLPWIASVEPPMVDSVTPSTRIAGSGGFTLDVYGTDFANGATGFWNWVSHRTTVLSSTQLEIYVDSLDLVLPDSATIAIVNSDGGTDGAIFVVQPEATSNLKVRLFNSEAKPLPGGALQYYESSWKDATSNGDGSFSVNTTQSTVSLRMTYAYGSQTKQNVSVSGGPMIFQTTNVSARLNDSFGNPVDTGTVQYYAGAWRDFGATTNGIASKELLPGTYSFRMTYASGSNDKQQDIGANPTVVFQTVKANALLQNSQGTPIDVGTVQYYAGAWRAFGTTTNGVATKELLPNTYSFRMTYAYGSNDKQQNIGTDPNVIFRTVNATVQLKDSQGNLRDQGTVQYYAGAWRSFGTTSGGISSKELLPTSYSFRMTSDYVSNDKTQDLSSNSTVSFSSVLCTISVKNGQGEPVSGATISYYAGAWRTIGTTANGVITKELLPANLSFRVSYNGATQDKTQNIGASPAVEFVLP